MAAKKQSLTSMFTGLAATGLAATTIFLLPQSSLMATNFNELSLAGFCLRMGTCALGLIGSIGVYFASRQEQGSDFHWPSARRGAFIGAAALAFYALALHKTATHTTIESSPSSVRITIGSPAPPRP